MVCGFSPTSRSISAARSRASRSVLAMGTGAGGDDIDRCVWRGLSEENGSWNTIWMRRRQWPQRARIHVRDVGAVEQHLARHRDPAAGSRSAPVWICPSRIRPRCPSVSPRAKVSETSSTAVTMLPRENSPPRRNRLVRLVTATSGAAGRQRRQWLIAARHRRDQGAGIGMRRIAQHLADACRFPRCGRGASPPPGRPCRPPRRNHG